MIRLFAATSCIVRRNSRLRWLGAVLVLSAGVLWYSGVLYAQDNQRCFVETGYCIAGPIRDYWEAHGGVAVFGFPITPLRVEQVGDWRGPTQWFERERLEDHGAAGVMRGRLGAEALDEQGRPWFLFPPVYGAPDTCLYFRETKHSLCEPFLSYWAAHGGVERFGYPITEAFGEYVASSEWLGSVQYFERARLEWHRDVPGDPVLAGLLGREVLAGRRLPTAPQGVPDIFPQSQSMVSSSK